MRIAKRIKELREENKINKTTLAKAIGVDLKTVTNWENEINEPKAGYIVKLTEYFKVSADYLLGRED